MSKKLILEAVVTKTTATRFTLDVSGMTPEQIDFHTEDPWVESAGYFEEHDDEVLDSEVNFKIYIDDGTGIH